MPAVFATHALHRDAAALLAGRAELRIASAPTAEALLAEIGDADALIVRAKLPPAIFAAAPKLRAAIRHGAGLDMIPLDAATAAGVLVANVPGANARSVAEYVAFAILALARRFRAIDADLRRHGWAAARAHAEAATEIAGLAAGVIGPGQVGRAVQRVLSQGLGMPVRLHGRSDGAAALDALLTASDVVVLCCPLTEATRGLLDRAQFARMKPGALLVNVARGPVLDEAALVQALRDGRLGGAALDVFAAQPLPDGHPLFGFDNVLLTPHLAGITGASMQRMGVGAVEEALRVLDGRPPMNLVNPAALERHRARFPAAA